jgi:hypothetical protein
VRALATGGRVVVAAAALLAFGPVASASSPAGVPGANAELPDPARLAVARALAALVVPDGTMEDMIASVVEESSEAVLAGILGMTLSELADAAGEDPPPPGEFAGDQRLLELILQIDPHFLERQAITNKVMADGMRPVFAKMEPLMREAMADFYARVMTEAELRDVLSFAESDVGRKYLRESMRGMSDPAIQAVQSSLMPELMRIMPEIMREAETATRHLPPPKRPAQTPRTGTS